MKKSISVIIPFFNSELFIGRMLDSILSSTCMPSEILLIDDGSTDNSGKLIQEYSSKYSFIKYVKKEHSGVSASRNLGITIATGDFISFLDADDYIEPNMYEMMLASITDDSFDGCICGYFTHKGDVVTPYCSDTLSILHSEDIIQHMFTDDDIRGVIFTRLFKRSLIKDHAFDEDVSICEDLLFQTKLFSSSPAKFAYVKAPLYHYIQNEGSATVTRNLFNNGEFIYAPAFNKIRQCINADFVDESYASIADYSMYSMLLAHKKGDKAAISQIRQLQRLLRKIPMKKKDLHSIAYRYAPLLYSLRIK